MSDKTTHWTHHSSHLIFEVADKARNTLCEDGYGPPLDGSLKQVKVRRRTKNGEQFEVITRTVSPTHYADLRKAGDPAGAGAIVSRGADNE